MDPSVHWCKDEIVAAIKSFPFWYQRIHLGQGVYTTDEPAHHEGIWQRLDASFPRDLRGASVLDVGTNAGYFAIQVKRRGAGRVLGIESSGDYFRQAVLCRRVLNLDIEYRHMDAHQLEDLGEYFDIVIFTGILYHLKNPLQVLEQVGRLCRDAIVVETEILADDPRTCVFLRRGPAGQTHLEPCRTGIMKFVEGDELGGDPSNWWVPDTECVFGMLRTAGFKNFSRPCYVADTRLLLIGSKKTPSILDLNAWE